MIFSTCGDPELVSVFDKRKWRFWITGVLTFGTGILGLLGNILSILTLSDKLVEYSSTVNKVLSRIFDRFSIFWK